MRTLLQIGLTVVNREPHKVWNVVAACQHASTSSTTAEGTKSTPSSSNQEKVSSKNGVGKRKEDKDKEKAYENFNHPIENETDRTHWHAMTIPPQVTYCIPLLTTGNKTEEEKWILRTKKTSRKTTKRSRRRSDTSTFFCSSPVIPTPVTTTNSGRNNMRSNVTNQSPRERPDRQRRIPQGHPCFDLAPQSNAISNAIIYCFDGIFLPRVTN